MPTRPQSVIAVLAMSPVPELDIFGPFEVFKTANRLGQQYQMVLLSADASTRLEGATGIPIEAYARFDAYEGPIDTLIVIADEATTRAMDEPLKAWIRARAETVRRICSVCTGAFVLAACGLLDGRRATTHWLYERMFRSRFPNVDLDISAIWTQDGKLYTSAGVSTGIDLALALVEADCGNDVALKIAKGLVLPLRRAGTQRQFSHFLARTQADEGRIQALPAWILENLHGDLTIPTLADRAGMSPRNFCRIFEQTFGVPPGAYVRNVRLDEARRCLETTELPWKEIAARCGCDGESLRRAFVRRFGVTPQHYAVGYQMAG